MPGRSRRRGRGALWRHGRGTQSRGGSPALRGAGAVSNRKSARYSTEAPPPKSLEVEPGNEAIYLDYVIAHNQWMK